MKLAIAPSTADLELREACERAMHAVFACLGIPRSFLDLDCEDGYMVRAARMFGCKPALGLTRSHEAKRAARRYAHLIVGEVFDVTGQFDLITSLHGVPSGSVAHMLSDHGHLVIASAFPFEKGAEFSVNGLVYYTSCTEDLQETWAKVPGPLPNYVQVYSNEIVYPSILQH